MSKPRIFISSTYFDLKSIRAELNRFILDRGYEAVEHEQNQIPWGKAEDLEAYCYQEVGFCDILVSIIGGRFGSESRHSDHGYSISQMELRTAHRLGKQVYIFVERDVHTEHRTYVSNRGQSGVHYVSVDNIKIFEFLDEVYSLPKNNPVTPFDTGGDIVRALQEQWAGLFQRLLANEADAIQIQLLRELKSAVYEIRGIAAELRNTREVPSNRRAAFVSPLPKKLKESLKLGYEPDITDLAMLTDFLEGHGFVEASGAWADNGFVLWRGTERNICVSSTLWDKEGKLVQIDPADWDDLLFQVLSSDDESPILLERASGKKKKATGGSSDIYIT